MRNNRKTALFSLLVILLILFLPTIKSQNSPYWQVGIGLGELLFDGSFKPSITFGYHFNEKLYAGVIYQFKDKIHRNEKSINARSTGLDGLESSSETVAQRFLIHLGYTPIKNGPYISTGFVFNGTDTETMKFGNMDREIGDKTYNGSIEIEQTRPAGWGFAMGLGYQYHFKNGFSTGFEWTPAWFQYATPQYQFAGSSNISESSQALLQNKMDEAFKQSVTNMYKVFHIGISYRFQTLKQ